jgi:hypothetical protein
MKGVLIPGAVEVIMEQCFALINWVDVEGVPHQV